MGKPAARLSDTANTCNDPVDAPMGKVIAASTVLINNIPAAKQGDQIVGVDIHILMVPTPGGPVPTPIPHPYTGMIDGGLSTTVQIEGMAAAVQGSTATNNPPHIPCGPGPFQKPPTNRATIIMGSPNVLVGVGGGGGGSGGSGAEAPAPESGHYLDVKVVDKGGKPITGVAYRIKSPDNRESCGVVSGRISRTGVVEGNHEISIMAITKAAWSKNKARDGEKVNMQVETAGFEDGTPARLEVWERNLNRPDVMVVSMDDIQVSGGKVESEWEYKDPEGGTEALDQKAATYNLPSYYFIVKIDSATTRSAMLDYKDYIEIELRDDEDNPISDVEYVLYVATGEIRRGTLDSDGYAKEERIPPGRCHVEFTDQSDLVGSE